MTRRTTAALLVLATAGILAGIWLASGAGRARRPNILLVTIDTLRADRLGCYGREGARTPTLDRLAGEGVLFERCYASAPVTRPSHASILTGLEPWRHGVRDNLFRALPAGHPTLAEALGREGYRSAAVVAAEPLVAASGLDRGFDAYDDRLEGPGRGGAGHFVERTADQVTDAALAFLDSSEAGRPFLLWVHYFDPHAEYAPPAAFREGARDAYDGEIAFVDHELGRLVARLEDEGRFDQTLVAITADHGEALGEHGEPTHAYFVYDSTLRVPLVLRHPGSLPSGARIARPVRTIDIMPTLLQAAGIDPAAPVDGRSLLGLTEGDGPPPDRVAYAESYEGLAQYGWRPLLSVRAEGFKLIDWGEGRRELYRVDDDPGERHDLLSVSGPGAFDADLKAVYERLAGEIEGVRRSRPSQGIAEVRVGAEQVLRNRSLGYGGYSSETPGREPPRDPAGFLKDVNRILDLGAQGLHHRALLELGRLQAVDPKNPYLLLLSGTYREEMGDLAGAKSDYDSLAAVRSGDPLATRLAIHIRLELELWAEAALRCEEALAKRDDDPFLWGSKGYAYYRMGRRRESVEALERAVHLDPDSETYQSWLAAARG